MILAKNKKTKSKKYRKIVQKYLKQSLRIKIRKKKKVDKFTKLRK
jgi:hypothetical protein